MPLLHPPRDGFLAGITLVGDQVGLHQTKSLTGHSSRKWRGRKILSELRLWSTAPNMSVSARVGRCGICPLLMTTKFCICTCHLLTHSRTCTVCRCVTPLREAVETAKQIGCSVPWRECSGCNLYLVYRHIMSRNQALSFSEIKDGKCGSERSPPASPFGHRPWTLTLFVECLGLL